MNPDTTPVQEKLDTTLLMTSSAVLLAVLGFGSMFFSDTIAASFSVEPGGFVEVLFSVAGTLYLGYAILNWMAREKLIGGIYSRPVAMGNFTHFLAGAVVLVTYIPESPQPLATGVLAGAYAVLAASFGVLVMGSGRACA